MALKRSQKSLKKWTKQDWGYITKGDSKKPRRKRGRYLPRMRIERREQLIKKARQRLSTQRGLQKE